MCSFVACSYVCMSVCARVVFFSDEQKPTAQVVSLLDL